MDWEVFVYGVGVTLLGVGCLLVNLTTWWYQWRTSRDRSPCWNFLVYVENGRVVITHAYPMEEVRQGYRQGWWKPRGWEGSVCGPGVYEIDHDNELRPFENCMNLLRQSRALMYVFADGQEAERAATALTHFNLVARELGWRKVVKVGAN
jgi:hypothetical protein